MRLNVNIRIRAKAALRPKNLVAVTIVVALVTSLAGPIQSLDVLAQFFA